MEGEENENEVYQNHGFLYKINKIEFSVQEALHNCKNQKSPGTDYLNTELS